MSARTWDDDSFGAHVHRRSDPDAQIDDASRARETMIEAIAEVDDELMAACVDGRELPAALDHAPRSAA